VRERIVQLGKIETALAVLVAKCHGNEANCGAAGCIAGELK